jgi:peptidoglycan hydrolase-like protein with peptidoglycan-binding domain
VPEPLSPAAGVELIASSLALELESLGYHPGAVTGQLTRGTESALRRFQAANSVAVDERGALGPATSRALSARLGGSTAAVQALQSALTDADVFTGTINGQYDAGTVDAVQALQRRAGIADDGFYGPRTEAALAAVYVKTDPAPSVTVPGAAPALPASGDTSEVLKAGSEGAAVARLQDRLIALGYRPGPADGSYGAATASAVLAFEKRQGLARDGEAGPSVQNALNDPTGTGPESGPIPRIDVDIARQIAFVVLPSKQVITLNVSTGSGETYSDPSGGTDVAYTPVGTFKVLRKIAGDERAPLGTLHNPMYFYKGWAIHGASNVPAYPASHGCVRISNADADWLFGQIPIGTPVIIYDPTGKSPSVNDAPPTAAPGY